MQNLFKKKTEIVTKPQLKTNLFERAQAKNLYDHKSLTQSKSVNIIVYNINLNVAIYH